VGDQTWYQINRRVRQCKISAHPPFGFQGITFTARQAVRVDGVRGEAIGQRGGAPAATVINYTRSLEEVKVAIDLVSLGENQGRSEEWR
jgi:hypothetical protein